MNLIRTYISENYTSIVIWILVLLLVSWLSKQTNQSHEARANLRKIFWGLLLLFVLVQGYFFYGVYDNLKANQLKPNFEGFRQIK